MQEIVVIGGGHAGYEAALAASKMGIHTALVTSSIQSIARLSCNPAIGGIAKGHLVREIDALGGIMAKAIDETGIQFRMLNKRKGPAVWAPRAQADSNDYPAYIQNALLSQNRLVIIEDMVEAIIHDGDQVTAVKTVSGKELICKKVIVCTGTFLNGLIHIGKEQFSGGRIFEPASLGISKSLQEMGLKIGRLKTGTPPRINPKTVNYDLVKKQPGDENPEPFSYSNKQVKNNFTNCWITRTTSKTKKIIQDNLHMAPLFSGQIQGIGPRYCPSIEDKIVRFDDREDHHVFLEPEDKENSRIYINGASTSLPKEIQEKMIKSIIGLEEVEILQYGYAIEYDFAHPDQLKATLESKKMQGLFLAGQINGTSGYEEAAAQGLMAGINAVLSLKSQEQLVLKRSEAYIGVLIDDLITKEILEPYRMFTSRAEHRLLLRQDNADMRLCEYGFKIGLLEKKSYQKYKSKEQEIVNEIERLKSIKTDRGASLAALLKQPAIYYNNLKDSQLSFQPISNHEVANEVEILIKYEGYIAREYATVEKMKRLENMHIPADFSYGEVIGLRTEALQKLEKFKPSTLAQASRIAGVNPSDINLITIWLHRKKEQVNS